MRTTEEKKNDTNKFEENDICREKQVDFIRRIGFSAEDFIPTKKEIQDKLGPDYRPHVDFLLWIKETSTPKTKEDYDTILFIEDILYDYFNNK